MTDRQSFLTAIATDPDEDSVRLVYADWLEENGEGERAEFLRCQIELAKLDAGEQFQAEAMVRSLSAKQLAEMSPSGSGIRRQYRQAKEIAGLPNRVQKLLSANSREWFSLVPLRIGDSWHRGFVSSLTCSWADWRTHAASLAWHPSEGEPKGCTACGGTGQIAFSAWNGYHNGCPACSGTGSRPCPLTVCPAVKVTLTTLPDEWVFHGDRMQVDWNPVLNPDTTSVGRMIRDAYPGVREFVLPPPPEPQYRGVVVNTAIRSTGSPVVVNMAARHRNIPAYDNT